MENDHTPETGQIPEPPPRIKLADERILEELKFAADAPEVMQYTEDAWVRDELRFLGVQIAGDINMLGCTGIVGRHTSVVDGVQFEIVEIAKRVHRGLAGSGCVLPCFVGPDRFCLVHNTIGGLQDGQKQHHPEYVAAVSRDLTDKERGHIKAVESARRADERSARATVLKARDILVGDERASMDNVVEEDEPIDLTDAEPEHARMARKDAEFRAIVSKGQEQVRTARKGAEMFSCPEHGETFWRCRFCVAQAIISGDLEMEFFLRDSEAERLDRDGYMGVRLLVGDDVEAAVGKLQDQGASSVSLYARVARWRRKLARE